MDHVETTPDIEALFDGDQFERNHIGGSWIFPRAPFELEIFSPVTSEVLAVVPFSSRFDVDDAVAAATAARSSWQDATTRRSALARVVDRLAAASFELAEQQSAELGLVAADSSTLVAGALSLAERLTTDEVPYHPSPGTVVGHILGWGSPVIEMAASVLPSLFSGHPVVIKPSIRAPLTVASMVAVLVESDLPAGAVNLVQGQGTDVGSAMVAHPGIDTIVIRGSASTVTSVTASCRRRGRTARGTAGPEQHLIVAPAATVEQLDVLLETVMFGLRANTAGGPLGLQHVHCHRSVAAEFEERLRVALPSLTPAPLVNDATRRATGDTTAAWIAEPDARIVAGTLDVPDDRIHRMGWFRPPVVIERSVPSPPAPHPAGPVLTWSINDNDPAPTIGPRYGIVESDLMTRVAAGDIGAGWFDRSLT